MTSELPALQFMQIEEDGNVLLVSLDRADKRNTLSAAFMNKTATIVLND